MSSLLSDSILSQSPCILEEETKECRICFQTENQSDILMHPCACRGTMSCVHEQCLIRWLTEKNISRCELCKKHIEIMQVFSPKRLFKLVITDLKRLLSNRERLMRLSLKLLCFSIYIRHFLPIVRFLRTKMLRNLCILWMIFEQEEKMRTAFSFSLRMKAKQIVTQEIPITIKLMVFMWVLRKFVSIGAKALLQLCKFAYKMYIKAKEMRFVRQTNVQYVENNNAHPYLRDIEQIDARLRFGSQYIGDDFM